MAGLGMTPLVTDDGRARPGTAWKGHKAAHRQVSLGAEPPTAEPQMGSHPCPRPPSLPGEDQLDCALSQCLVAAFSSTATACPAPGPRQELLLISPMSPLPPWAWGVWGSGSAHSLI